MHDEKGPRTLLHLDHPPAAAFGALAPFPPLPLGQGVAHFPAWNAPLLLLRGIGGGGQGQASPSTYTCRTSPAPMACYTVRWLQLATGLLGIQNPPLPLPGGLPTCPEGRNSLPLVLCLERFGSLKWWFSKWSVIQMLPSHNL